MVMLWIISLIQLKELQNKKRILDNAKVKDNAQKLIDDFQGSESAFRFVYESKKRSAYARKIDEDFYNEVIRVLEKFSKYLILINSNKMFHLWTYKNVIKSHHESISKLCDQVIKKIDKENEY